MEIFFFLVSKTFIHFLSVRVPERERPRENIPSAVSLSKWSQLPVLGQAEARSQEIYMILLCGWQGPKDLVHGPVLSSAITRDLDWNWSSRGHEPVPIWNTGVISGSLTHYIAKLALSLHISQDKCSPVTKFLLVSVNLPLCCKLRIATLDPGCCDQTFLKKFKCSKIQRHLSRIFETHPRAR